MITALIIGIAFGFVLERGGLGNPKKLAAQFYLTDMTIFKVMFTAIVTAMIGIFLLTTFGIMEFSQFFVSPTFVLPQLLGGIVFGVGFVVGGYCPGTSCVSASSGRRDAFVFVGGMIGGIFLFGEMFRFVSDFYYSMPLGKVTLPRLFHVPYGVVVCVVALLAIGGFVAAENIEKRYSKKVGTAMTPSRQEEPPKLTS